MSKDFHKYSRKLLGYLPHQEMKHFNHKEYLCMSPTVVSLAATVWVVFFIFGNNPIIDLVGYRSYHQKH